MSGNTRNFTVIFDMDGVIIDDNPYHKQAWKEFCKKYRFALSEDEFKKHIYGWINKDILDFLFKRDLSIDEINKYGEEKEEIFKEIYQPYIQLPDGLLCFLEALKSNRIKTAIATSAPKGNVDFVFDNLNIKNYFDVVVDESFVTNGKPDPEIYLKAAELLGVNPRQCIVIEDSIPGVNAAINAGMTVIAIMTTHNEEELKNAHLVIRTFRDLDIEKLISISDFPIII